MLNQSKLGLVSIGLGIQPLLPEQEVDSSSLRESVKLPPAYARPEVELLFSCARTHLDAVHVGRIGRLLREEMDWGFVIQTASRWRVRPLLYQNLKAAGPDGVPEAILARLEDHFHANARRNLFLVGELIKILRLFEAHGIPTIPYKGPALAAWIYASFALRECGDLDLLVRKKDVIKAKSLLISEGYRSTQHLTVAQEMAFLGSPLGYHLGYEDGDVGVELHWRVAPPYFAFPFDLDYLWEGLELMPLGGATVRQISPQALLLVLCVHGAKHHWERLSWICDVAELVRIHTELDWGQVLAQANRLGCKRIVFLGLLLACTLLEVDLPPEVRSEIQTDPIVESLATEMHKPLFSEDGGSYGGTDWHTYHLRIKERRQDRILYLLRWAFNRVAPDAQNHAALPVSPMRSFFYYLLRPIQLLREDGLGSFKYLWGLFKGFWGV